ncbi:MAG TPA: hypothetical protein VEJ67_11770 [Candidatus Cybelea sp.]|nr:hypothetical protein [Candidatus Cybelea sp.]
MIRPLIEHPSEEKTRGEVPALNQLAVRGLVSMFDPTRKLFCNRLVRNQNRMVREGHSERYTLISILGLQRAQDTPETRQIRAQDLLVTLASDTRWLGNLGDLGLLLWAAAEAGEKFSSRICSAFDLGGALRRFREARQGRTTELAWFLSGLAHLRSVDPDRVSLREVALETYALLKQNQGESGLFSHLAERKSLGGLVRGRVGTFADQVYPIYALSKFSQSFGVPKAAERALDCALTLCELQGPLGQWWWHYDSVTGKVVARYPVYSVHQDGMAPLALFALGEAVQSDFRPWICKGLRWVFGDNELEEDMRDDSSNLIWRAIYRTDSLRHVDSVLEVLSMREDVRPRKELARLFECRPYHLGWLLYAWASQATRNGCESPGPLEGRSAHA